jgi:hypothetical protein
MDQQNGKRQTGNVAFALGTLVATPGALAEMVRLGINPVELLARHANGDWGDLCDEDKAANADALKTGARIFSAYEVRGVKFWVITESDRSVTTTLLPSEY